MVIKILGGGCKNCQVLYKNTQKALEELGVEATIEKVEDFKEIMKYGVMKTPALVVDEKVKISGRVVKPEEIKKVIQK
ncbi:thioredoxin family protein [Tepidibacter formicigenes]|jgi:small redox-active disulfide protein 2|uniref:Small redox-active disulfide protein 2 n=1 Tax=Tepidibacter formicigenes DSM 15518 TaxID=1123349 RepID=A0A1M6LI43_9FIRM|nr:thioredoxin family protein [Tepidibacter formicigenes]SHJ70848.1 small redox-active disulfide protein 2 [Tepidibacter formicigenes DSM 15518]